MTTKERCSETVYDSTGFGHFYQCSRSAVVERDGKPYCKIHDPEYIKRKDAERQAKYEASNCKHCGSHFYHHFYSYCPMCGTKRSR